ncbi:DUF551 domain-containing protein, partial [Raoultella planticola]|nr:DUF551 domain-containing protein [Raoultella planticola]
MRDHEIRELVNQLRDVAIKYHGAGQLREQIARTVRAAIIQAQANDDGEPTDDERIMAIEGIHNCERCGDQGWIVGEMGITRCACGQAGNSPVHSDRFPEQSSGSPAQSPIDHGYRPECECSGCQATARICAELAGNSPALSPSREHFISLCNEFWGWSDMDMICADDKGYEPRLEWNGQSFTHPVTRGLWRMYQATPGSSPVIPDGYVMVPIEPTEAMMLHKSGCQHHAWDDPDCAMRQTRRLIWSHMLAAAPQLPGSEPATVPDRWIPVSERMPEKREGYLVWDGKRCVIASFLSGSFVRNQFFTDEITHWMPL